ncbi:Excalibur calcium-binding domain-containing protein [Jatrophihabitans endophyticus]|uniref:Excalibur calcium-binding domain-containing protein n=1 Tax=Jatrophihabitans endophyticus TaxID=1206085 RepID=A0A1M5GVL6_9ACTN|nr:excalibur calcium-binding domain-containing protein [Jatrophihabitans endophyticus]SHG07472.1 Excalibur calcium-binding domain-containing protein [Jatrophihabitans endophyticus]
MTRKLVPTVLCATLAAAAVLIPAESADAAAKTYKNCTALHAKYPHGVGKKGAHDVVRGKTKPVTNFTRSNALYRANKKSDRDHDGVACEAR